jgi:hypothetical protein
MNQGDEDRRVRLADEQPLGSDRRKAREPAPRWAEFSPIPLFRDGETPRQFVELFVVPSWDEHMRQHADRLTGTDQHYEEEARALSDPPEETSHLIAVEVPDDDL